MAVEFDHLFVCATSGGADEAAALIAFGLTEGVPNTHPGQGTACRRFFFRNAYLELLWVTDQQGAQSEPIRPTHLWDRWMGRRHSACPFGFGFRPRAQGVGGFPFAAWEYRPPYLAEPLYIHVASNAHALTEPMLFYLPFALRPDAYTSANRPLSEHAVGLREITDVQFISPHVGSLSPELAGVSRAHLVRLRLGAEYLVKLGFDGEAHGQTADSVRLCRLFFVGDID